MPITIRQLTPVFGALHRERPYAITEHARILHRTTAAGDGPTVH